MTDNEMTCIRYVEKNEPVTAYMYATRMNVKKQVAMLLLIRLVEYGKLELKVHKGIHKTRVLFFSMLR